VIHLKKLMLGLKMDAGVPSSAGSSTTGRFTDLDTPFVLSRRILAG
jgi:hypothetical protein